MLLRRSECFGGGEGGEMERNGGGGERITSF